MLGDVQFSGLFPLSTYKKATRSTGGIIIRSLKLDGFKLWVILPFSIIGNLLKFLWIYYGYRKNSEVLIAQV
jgi:hypothetical protein